MYNLLRKHGVVSHYIWFFDYLVDATKKQRPYGGTDGMDIIGDRFLTCMVLDNNPYMHIPNDFISWLASYDVKMKYKDQLKPIYEDSPNSPNSLYRTVSDYEVPMGLRDVIKFRLRVKEYLLDRFYRNISMGGVAPAPMLTLRRDMGR